MLLNCQGVDVWTQTWRHIPVSWDGDALGGCSWGFSLVSPTFKETGQVCSVSQRCVPSEGMESSTHCIPCMHTLHCDQVLLNPTPSEEENPARQVQFSFLSQISVLNIMGRFLPRTLAWTQGTPAMHQQLNSCHLCYQHQICCRYPGKGTGL